MAENCLEVAEFNQLLGKWRAVSLKYAEASTLPTDSAHGSTAPSVTSSSKHQKSKSVDADLSKLDVSSHSGAATADGSSTSKNPLQKLNANFKKMQSQLHSSIPQVQSSGSLSLIGSTGPSKAPFVVDASYQETTASICQLLAAINAQLGIPATSVGAEYAQAIAAWLLSLGVVQQVTRLADHAFALPTTYYKYIDAWEVSIVWRECGVSAMSSQ